MNEVVHKLTRPVVKLATAAWHRSPLSAIMEFRPGDFWLGRLQDGTPVGFNDDRHVLLCSGTRGGKGASVIIPNLISWFGSAVVIDPKGENAMVTARARGRGSRYCQAWLNQKIRILDPFNEVRTDEDDFSDAKVSFNPLDMLDPQREESIDDAARIADALVVSESSNDPYWEESARTLLKAIILHVVSSPNYLPHERNLVTVRRLLLAGDARAKAIAGLTGKKKAPSGLSLLFRDMKKNKAFGGVVADAGEMLGNLEKKGERTFACIAQVACTNTDFIESPGMKRCLSKSDFSLSELKTDPAGTTLYICLPQRFMETHARWLRMITTLTITEMERVRHRPARDHRVLMVLDEFAALKRMRVVENAAAQMAGFGVKFLFAVQTLVQLKDLYRDNWETFVANSGIKLFFNNDDDFTRQYVSKLIGEGEVIRMVRNASETEGTSSSVSTSTTKGLTLSESTSESSSFTTGSSAQGGANSSHTLSSSKTWGVSRSGSDTEGLTRGASESRSNGRSETLHKRALLSPDEVGREFGDRHDDPAALALVSGHQPIRLRRCFYFAERVFLGFFDRHPDHEAPMTLPQIEDFLAEERMEKEKAEDRARLRDIMESRLKLMMAHEQRRRQEQAAYEEACRQYESHQQALRDAWRWQRKYFIEDRIGIVFLLAFGAVITGVPLSWLLW